MRWASEGPCRSEAGGRGHHSVWSALPHAGFPDHPRLRTSNYAHTARLASDAESFAWPCYVVVIPKRPAAPKTPPKTIEYIPGSRSNCRGRSRNRSTSSRGRQRTAIGDIGSREDAPRGSKRTPADLLRRHRGRGGRKPVATGSAGDAAKRGGRHHRLHRPTTRTKHASSCCSGAVGAHGQVQKTPGCVRLLCCVGSRGRDVLRVLLRLSCFLCFRKRCRCSALRST